MIYREKEINSSFSTILPTLQLAWDSTSLGSFKLCPRRYQYEIIEGYVAPVDDNVHLKFGIEYHSALEYYDHLRSDKISHKDALHATVKFALTRTWDSTLSRPWLSGNPNKNRETLIRSIIGYLDTFSDDSLETIILSNNRAAVELSFNLDLPGWIAITGESFILCGHIDRLVNFSGGVWVSDRKTTKNSLSNSYFAMYSPDNQVSLYSYAGKVIFSNETKGLIIDAAQILVSETRYQRGIVPRSDSQLEEWISDTNHYLTLAQTYAKNNYYPQNDRACGSVYVDPKTDEVRFGCPFRPVCGSAPEIRETLLRLNYERRVWDPLRVRERPILTER
jgi:hypothetical protein